MNSRDDEKSKVDSKFNKGKERVKNVALWIVSILFLLFFVLYSKEALVPSIGILIAGFLIMPPINAQIRKHISNKNQGTYTAIKTIMVITLLLVFLSNIPQSESNNLNVPQITDANTIPSIDENSIKENNLDENYISNTEGITYSSGHYIGDSKGGKKNGKGTFIWNDGSKYEGEWKDDKIEGNGTLTIPNKGMYVGTFKNGKRDGKGRFKFENGDEYVGDFKEDAMSGEGRYIFKNGDKYEGSFLNNQFNGHGTYTKDGKTYSGTWEKNELKNKD